MNISEKIKSRAPEIFVLLLTLLLIIGLATLTELQPTISDSIGYIVAGQSLASGWGLTFVDSYNVTSGPFFYPHAFRMIGENTAAAVFSYPPGYPVLIGIAIFLSGSNEAAHFVVPFLAAFAIPLTYWLGWLLTENKWVGVWSSLLLASTESFWRFSTAPWSEIPSLFFLLSGIGAYVYSRQKVDSKSIAIVTAVIGGGLIGYSLFIRYTNAILVIPALLLYEFYTGRFDFFKEKTRWVFYFVVGMFAIGVLLFNWISLGGPFNSIYSTPELGAYPWPYFSLSYAFGPSPIDGFSFHEVTVTLWDNFHVLLLLAPVGWLTVKRSNALLTGGIVLATVVLYSIYAFAPKDINTRFLLPMFPFLSVVMAAGGIKLSNIFIRPRWFWLFSFAIICLLYFPIISYAKEIQSRNEVNAARVNNVKQLMSQAPEESVWLSTIFNDLIIVYGNRSALNYRRMLLTNSETGEFDQDRFESCLIQTVDRLLEADVPIFFILDQGWNTSDILQENFELIKTPFSEDIVEVSDSYVNRQRSDQPECRGFVP